MPDGLNTYKSTLTGPELDAALRNIGLVEQNIAAAAASAEAAANSAEDAKIAAQQAGGFRTFFSAISPDEAGTVDPSRPMTTAAAQASWTVKSKGDRIQSVQVNGFTQDGANAGIALVHLNVTSGIVWVKAGTRGAYQYTPKNIAKKTNNADKALIYCSALPVNSANNTYAGSAGISVNNSGVLQINFGEMSPQDYISINGPFDIWYVPEDSAQATGLYIPIQAQGHEYRCQCLPVTEALGSGDNVQSNVPSGCNQVVILDGSSDEAWTVLGTNGSYELKNQIFPETSGNNAKACILSNYLPAQSANNVYIGKVGISFNASGQLSIKLPGGASPAEYLPEHPLGVWYRSADYAEQSDILVELETHANGNVYAHDAVDLVAVPYTDADSEHTLGTYDVSSQEGTTVSVSLKPMQDGGNAATIAGHTWEDIQKLISDAVASAVQLSLSQGGNTV